MPMTIDLAAKIVAASIRHAEAIGIYCSIAVVDENGWLIALYRMDGALSPTADIARDKAWTAAAFKMPSSEIVRFGVSTQPGGGFSTANWNDRLTVIPGGLPINVHGEFLGGIGISGGTPKQDVSVGEAALREMVV
jgi:uncharacterized protein GlcG (DUF336 family)